MNGWKQVIAIGLSLGSTGVAAVTLQGAVRSADGSPIVGAMVTATSADRLFAQTVYTGANGSYRMDWDAGPPLSLRARKAYFADVTQTIETAPAPTVDTPFSLSELTAAKDIDESLSASAHYARIRFDDPRERAWFQIECLTCHQLGNAYTRAPKSQERWTQVLTRMLGFYGVKDEAWIARYVGILSKAFDGTPITIRQEHTLDPLAQGARIRQWKLPDGIIAHDVEYLEADGRFYTVDQGADRIFITDPVRRTTETFEIPTEGIPQGGKFFQRHGDPAPFSLAVSRGPHSLQLGPDGHYYTTDTVSGQIGEFDPKNRRYTGHDIGGDAMYPHTLRFDKQGRVWFTLGMSNQIGYFDTRDQSMKVIALPPETDRPQMPALMPYGIDVHPIDGSIWFSSLMANRIGRIDPVTLEVKVFKPEALGPRRMRFGADGTLWIPSFGDGVLVKLDTRMMRYTRYPIPTLAPGEVEAPYALGVDPKSGEVWITPNMSDRMFRFLPKEERFIAYPLPTRGIYLRDIVFTPFGVCANSSPVPAPVTVEGGMQEVFCLDPGAAPARIADRAAQ